MDGSPVWFLGSRLLRVRGLTWDGLGQAIKSDVEREVVRLVSLGGLNVPGEERRADPAVGSANMGLVLFREGVRFNPRYVRLGPFERS